MKPISLILFMMFYLSFCNAQSNNDIYKDSSKILLSTFKFHSFNSTFNNKLNVPVFDFKSKTRFTIYQNQISNYYILYDSYRNEYKPIQPYSNFGSALIGGAINGIFMLCTSGKKTAK